MKFNIKIKISYLVIPFIFLFLIILPICHTLAAATVSKLTVVNISTPDKPGYSIFWPKGKGSVSLERSSDGKTFSTVATTDQSFYLDFSVVKDTAYTYRIASESATTSGEKVGQPSISDVQVTNGLVTKDEASLIVSFKTDTLAKVNLIYGETESYGSKTDQVDALNSSHIILLEKLKPATTYHLKIQAVDKTGKNPAESEDVVTTTGQPVQDLSVLQIIIDALNKAFSGFDHWFKS